MRLLLLALLLLMAAPLAAQAPARTPASDRVAQEAIAQLRSPYCPGLMLEVCPSGQAELLRDSIRDMAAQGQARDEIVEAVLARHGEEWRAVPKRNGFGMLAWIATPIVLLAGAALVGMRLRAMRAAAPAPAPAAPLDAAEEAHLAAALAEWKESE